MEKFRKKKFFELDDLYIESVLNFLDFNDREVIANNISNKRLFTINSDNIEKLFKTDIEKGIPVNNRIYPYNQIGHVQIMNPDNDEVIEIGNGILIDEDDTVIVPIHDSKFIQKTNDKFIFIYENKFLFTRQVLKVENNNEIQRLIHSLNPFRHNNSDVNLESKKQFFFLKLENKLSKRLKERPSIPDIIFTSIFSKKGLIFSVRIISFNYQRNNCLEISTLAKIDDDNNLLIEKTAGSKYLVNGASIYLNWNENNVLIGQVYKDNSNKEEKIQGFFLNIACNITSFSYNEEKLDNRTTFSLSTKSTSSIFDYENNTLQKLGSILINEKSYKFEEKIDGINIIYKICDSKFQIYYISLDLFLTYIATSRSDELGDKICDYFFIQSHAFLNQNALINKIRSLFEYFTIHLNVFPFKIISFTNKWVSERWCDENFPNEIRNQISEFYLSLEKYEESKNEDLLIERMIEIITQDSLLDSELMISRLKRAPKSQNVIIRVHTINSPKKNNHFDILDWDEQDIARQMTLYTHLHFSKINISELLLAKWTKKSKFQDSPNIMNAIERFNTIVLWVCEEVLAYDKKGLRARAIEKFILIAEECRKLRNFNDCLNIISGLTSLPLKFLKKSWKKVSQKIMLNFIGLTNFVSFEDNYKGLRNEIQNSKGQSYIPYLGIYLKELAYIEEGPKYLKGGLINLDKIRKIGEIIDDFVEFKKKAYLFKIIDKLSFLNNLKCKSEDALLELADKIEPKFLLSKPKNLRKRPTTTDALYSKVCEGK